MKNWLLIIVILIFSSGCSIKYTTVDICPEVAENGQLDLYIDTTGSSLTTTTDQKSDGKLNLDIPLEGL